MSSQPNIYKPMPNLVIVSIPEVDYYFSYETCIAVRLRGDLIISENIWSVTTGKHLNYVSRDHSIRIDNEKFNIIINGIKLSTVLQPE